MGHRFLSLLVRPACRAGLSDGGITFDRNSLIDQCLTEANSSFPYTRSLPAEGMYVPLAERGMAEMASDANRDWNFLLGAEFLNDMRASIRCTLLFTPS